MQKVTLDDEIQDDHVTMYGSIPGKHVYFRKVAIPHITALQLFLIEPISADIVELDANFYDDRIIVIPPKGLFYDVPAPDKHTHFLIQGTNGVFGYAQGPTLQIEIPAKYWVQQPTEAIFTEQQRVSVYKYTQYEGANALEIRIGYNTPDFPIPQSHEHEKFAAIKYAKRVAIIQKREELPKHRHAPMLITLQETIGTTKYLLS